LRATNKTFACDLTYTTMKRPMRRYLSAGLASY
jgi:hypothetical protein